MAAALVLALSPASLLPSSQPPPSHRTLSRRAAFLPLLAAPAAVSALELPNPFSNPVEDARRSEREAVEATAKAEREALYKKVRKERMAAEARAQSDEYTTRMNTYKFDSGTFGSPVSVQENDGPFRYKP